MASSVFADSPVSTNESRMCGGDSQSNLVVVYGKNGINVDRNGLDNLLEDRNVSSVSVVRLTSPTLSMKNEGEENERMEGDDSDLLSSLEFSSKNADEEEPEIVGLTVEEFYPREEAKMLAKEILNYAGVANPLQIKIDYEFQRFVIQNDHCYTPLTSPSQSKPKPAGDVQTPSDSKTNPLRQHASVNKVKKIIDGGTETDEKKTETEEDEDYSDYSDSSISDSDNDRDSDLDFNVNDRGRRRKTSTRKTRKSLTKTPKKRQSITERDFYMDDEQRKNAVAPRTNRQPTGSTPVTQKAAQKVITVSKPVSKPEKTESLLQVLESRSRVVVQQQQPQPLPQQHQNVQQQHHQVPQQQQRQQLQQQQQRQFPQQQQPVQAVEARPRVVVQQHQVPQQQRQLVQQQQLTQPQQQQPRQLQQQQQPQPRQLQQQQQQQQLQPLQQQTPKVQAQKVFLMKTEQSAVQVIDDTFNDISSMFTHKEVTKPPPLTIHHEPKLRPIQMPTTAVVRQIHQIPHSSQITAKGFMPLVVETAVKNQLPSQISIQTHTSSTDLAIENDKQLDLIDSIVKDEMDKTNIIVKNTHANEDIPQIVKMLESTENVVMNKAKSIDVSRIPATTTSSFTNPDEHFDIANADLLDNPDDDLYKDLLQHVAELRADKHLQEVIEKQGFIGSTPSPITVSESLVPITQPITQQQQPQPMYSGITDPQPPVAKKDPIQIVRGDGRVITLPPIEAPTTRAKRRAQSQHVTGSPTPTSTPKAVAAVVKVESIQRRESSEQQRNVASASKKRVSISSQSTPKEEFETESGQDSDSEDDPDKLWCICRQPHNNRFMICCDKCEDWFHGTCVNITKAMGREMEQTGKEWTCPKCVKESRPKKPVQKKISELFDKKTPLGQAKKQPEMKKPIPNFAKKIELKKPVETPTKKAPELIQKKLFDAVKPIMKQSAPPPLVKSVEVIQKRPVESIAPLPVVEQPQLQPILQRIKPEVVQSPKPKPPDASLLSCIVCKKTARPNSIYCSDDCIRRHAQNALITATKVSKASAAAIVSPSTPVTPDEKKKKIPSSFEEALAKAAEPTTIKNKVERVYVFERKTGRLLTGTNAPTTSNLKKWLQENPTFEVVLPGSPQALAIERSKQKQLKTPTTPDAPSLTPIKKMPEPKTESAPKVLKQPQMIEISRQTATPPQLKKYPQQVSLKPPTASQSPNESKAQAAAKAAKKQNATPEQKPPQPASTPSNKETEPIRLNVRKTLKEQLIARMNEMKLPETSRLTISEIEKFSNESENEMFKLFNRDAGTKYKAKYRSLMFNIKDRKNQTLFQKIMERKIQPKQLVKMSPEELASQELAQWRQNENKHQLEMIKKSELDLLSCTKNYVLKTHKGEEVIESKSIDRVSLDITIPVEDVVTVLNNSAVSSTSEVELMSPSKEQSNRTQSLSDLSQDGDSSLNTLSLSDSSKATVTTSTLERKKPKKQERDRDRHYRPKDKHKSSSRKRSRSRSRDRRHKSPHREERRDSNKDDKEKRESTSSKALSHNKKEEKKDEHHPHQEKTEKSESKDKGILKHFVKKEKDVKIKTEEKPVEVVIKTEKTVDIIKTEKTVDVNKTENKDYNLIDKILESSKTVEQAANLAIKKEKTQEKSTTTSTSSSVSTTTTAPSSTVTRTKSIENSPNADSDQEPTSTVNIPISAEDKYAKYSSDLPSILWSGSINMIDVATFQIVIQPVIGVTVDLEKLLPVELDVVGRITPESVWDYIEKIKKSPNKEVVVIRFLPSCESENTAYSALYMYLDTRNRLGVLKPFSPNIKDFYILPLCAKRTLPSILQPEENPEFFNDDTRPDLLLGIIIRIMGKRPATATTTAHHSKIARKSEASVISRTSSSTDETRYTPPSSPKNRSTKKTETKSIISASRLPRKSEDSIDISTILAPTTKISKSYTADDADEPYSPGGSTDDDEMCQPLNSKITSAMSKNLSEPMTDDLKRKMDEINRQIEAQKMEIAGMLGMERKSEPYSPSGSPTDFKPTLDSISIPSNLQQILASIKSSPQDLTPPPPVIGSLLNNDDEEYVPQPASAITYKPLSAPPMPPITLSQTSSRLAQLSEAELLSMVPDGMELNSSNNSTVESIRSDSPTSETPNKKPRWIKEPPPPGLEEEFL